MDEKIYEPRSEDELKKIAIGIKEGHIFTNFHIPKEQEKDMLHSVFMPLLFLSKEDTDRLVKLPVGMVYGEMDGKNNARMSINGFPIFYSCGFLSKADSDKVWGFHKELVEMEKEFMGK